ncbi:MAG: efflux RND transporter permease subunit [Aquisalimonadaceae bacterium]
MAEQVNSRSWIAWVARHAVAANLIMLLMVVSGLWALQQLNTQFFPTFELDYVSVRVEWRGATAEDVADAITEPLETELRDVEGLRRLFSTSSEGLASITLELEEGTDIAEATEAAKDRVARVRNLPTDAREPSVTRVVRYDPIARLLITGALQPGELRELARQFEDELLARGVTRIELTGIPGQEIRIELPLAELSDLGLTFQRLAGMIAAQSRDLPAGEAGDADVARQLRGLGQARDSLGFEQLSLVLDNNRTVTLGDVAEVTRQPREREVLLRFEGQPAIEMLLQRAEREDALKAARILEDYLRERSAAMPNTVSMEVFDEFWQFLSERIALLLENGVMGLVLVVAIILLFLSLRLAFWVSLSIPVSFLAAMTVLLAVGGSINMISLFGLIMALGIIVDNAIVVGENALARYQAGEAPADAAVNGARRMFAPVIAASLTTIAAFLPLMIIGGPIGNILFAIPLVVVCVIIASIIQAFLILPGHLRRTFERGHGLTPGRARARIDTVFNRFRDGPFQRAVETALDYRWATVAAAVGVLAVCVGLVPGGRLPFTFFPAVEGNVIHANVSFAAGTPRERVDAYLTKLEDALIAADAGFGGGLVRTHVVSSGRTLAGDPSDARQGEQFGAIMVELISAELREVRNRAFIRDWEQRTPPAPGLDSLVIRERGTGPPGSDIDIRLTGVGAEELKAASLALQDRIRQFPGVSGIADDLPFGPEQWIYRLRPEGHAAGLTVEEIGRQLRGAFAGELVQIFHHRRDEVEVWVRLAEAERRQLAGVFDYRIALQNGRRVPLSNVADIEARRGFEAVRHVDGELAVRVSADVDSETANANLILGELEAGFLPELQRRFGLQYGFEGRAADQAETLADMRAGLLLALALIYLVLAWVFASYGWPLIVMAVIPFGLVGALLGHYLMGLDLTVLSLFGLFGLTGIVVNNSIILVTFYRDIRLDDPEGDIRAALVEASRQRLRPVVVTTLTTIGALLPLIFETSLQAQFLIPMAVAIAFGLGAATLIVLFLVPAMLAIYETAARQGPQR